MKQTPMTLAAGLFALTLSSSLIAADLDGVMMKDGKLLSKNGGEKTELTGERTLTNGTKITANGSVTTADGKTFQLKDGDLIAEDGTYYTRVVDDGVVKKDGKIMHLKGREKSEVTSEITLDDGSRVSPDGSVVSKEGQKWELDDNDAILSDGRALLDGSIIVRDGKPLQVKHCMGTPIMEETSLDGTKVRTDLAVTQKDDRGETALKEGDIVKPDGNIIRAADNE